MAEAPMMTLNLNFDEDLEWDLPALGVPGYTHRHEAFTIPGSAGDSVTSWPDLETGGPMSYTNAGGSVAPPTLRAVGSDRYVEFDGVDDGLGKAITSGSVKTIAMLCRVTAASSTTTVMLFTGGVVVSRNTSNNGVLTFSAGGSASLTGQTSNVWRVVFVVVDGTSSVLAAGTTGLVNSPAPTGTSTDVMARIRFGYEGSSRGKIDIAAWAAWPNALTAGERETVRSNMQIGHPALLPA